MDKSSRTTAYDRTGTAAVGLGEGAAGRRPGLLKALRAVSLQSYRSRKWQAKRTTKLQAAIRRGKVTGLGSSSPEGTVLSRNAAFLLTLRDSGVRS